ncbi:MAG: F0F1 ATP synthase subunit B [Pseudomonadota bacterium]
MDFNSTLIGQTIAMIIFVWFCTKYIWPPLIDAIEARRKTIADGLAAAEQGQKDLEAASATAGGVERDARDKASKIISEAESRYNEIMEQARTDARGERERQLAAAQDEILQERNRARDELRAEVAGLALTSAEQIVRREIDAAAHKDLLDELVAKI